jgi:hypothetical protein
MKNTFRPLFVLVALASALCIVLHFAGLPKEVTLAFVSGILGFFPVLLTTLKEKEKPVETKIAQLVEGDTYIHPALAIASVICFLLFIQNTVGFLFGFALGMALGNSPASMATILTIVPVFTMLTTIIAVAPISKYVTHRTKKRPLLLIAIGIIATIVINGILNYFLMDIVLTAASVGPITVAALLLVPGVVIGYRRAKKRHSNFIMSKLFKELAPEDQTILIALVKTLPSSKQVGAALVGR